MKSCMYEALQQIHVCKQEITGLTESLTSNHIVRPLVTVWFSPWRLCRRLVVRLRHPDTSRPSRLVSRLRRARSSAPPLANERRRTSQAPTPSTPTSQPFLCARARDRTPPNPRSTAPLVAPAAEEAAWRGWRTC
jgi:hypothetical protein